MNADRLIVAAAIRQGGVICSLPRPKRHHDIINLLAVNGMPTPITGTQGFLTSDGIFLDRDDALTVARDAGQIKKKTGNESQLFSEDVW